MAYGIDATGRPVADDGGYQKSLASPGAGKPKCDPRTDPNCKAGINGTEQGEPLSGPTTANQGLTGRAWHDSGQRETARDAIMGASDPIAKAQQLGFNVVGDKVTFPDGETMDINIGTKAGNRQGAWTPVAGGSVVQGGMGSSSGGVSGGYASYGPYTPGALPSTPLPTYTPGTLPTFTRPDQAAQEQHTAALISSLLDNPTYSPGVVNAIKERDKEAAMKMAEDALGQSRAAYSRLGRADSGEAAGSARDIRSQMIADILSGNRETDIAAADANRQALERAIGLSENNLTNALNRASSAYSTDLSGRLAQEDLNQRGVQSGADAVRFALDRALQEENLKQAAAGLGIQEGGLNLDSQRLAEMIRQFNSQMNYNYGRDAQSYNQWLIDRALGGGQ